MHARLTGVQFLHVALLDGAWLLMLDDRLGTAKLKGLHVDRFDADASSALRQSGITPAPR
jgi:hypothetical protein